MHMSKVRVRERRNTIPITRNLSQHYYQFDLVLDSEYAMGRSKKRKHSQFVQDPSSNSVTTNEFGVAATLAQLQVPELPPFTLTSAEHDVKSDNNVPGSEEWELVDRRSKKQRAAPTGKEEKQSYPALNFAGHKLQSSISISDLQGLVLYALADGTSPQWISVRQHGQIRKAVVLMVPGLEKGMFDGNVRFVEWLSSKEVDSSKSVACNGEHENNQHRNVNGPNSPQAQNNQDPGRPVTSPDNYVPMPIVHDRLPEPLKPLAGIFPHIWPVKTPGDDRYYKVHSPLHAMLTTPVPKSKEEEQEERKTKGPKKTRAGKFWEDKRTPITTFIASPEELLENEYTLHSVLFQTEAEKEKELLRREQASQTSDHGWADTKVATLAAADVPEQDIEKGSLTAGREILAMDCEMCKTEGGGLDLTRISIVAWDGTVILDELVKPDKPVIDYLTPYLSIVCNFHRILSR